MKNSLEPSIELKQIDPRTRYFSALIGALLALLPLIPLWVLCVKFDWPLWLMLIYAVLAIFLAVQYAYAAHARFGYALLDDGLWLQSGVFWRKAAFVPRERVQHTEVNHGPLDRRMGLAKLVVHTAGLRLQHLTIPGLADAQAHALRDSLLKRAPTEQFEPSIDPAPHVSAAEVLSTPDFVAPPLATVEAAIATSEANEHQGLAETQVDLAPSQPPSPIV